MTALLLAGLVLTGCTGADGPDDATDSPTPSPAATTPGGSPTATPEESPSPEASPTPALGASCTNSELGVTVAYPEEWRTNDGDVLPSCSLFDPDPIDLEPATEIPPDLAVTLQGSDRQFATHADATDEPGTREIERRETTVDGRDAVAMLLEATEDAPLLEPGTRLYRWVIDLGVDEMTVVSTLLVVTYDQGEPAFDEKRRVLDAMVRSLDLDAKAEGDQQAALDAGTAIALGSTQQLSGVAVIDVTDGSVVRELTGEIGQGSSSLDWVPSRGIVLFARTVTAARTEIVEVPLDGGEPRVLDLGYAVDATDDGQRLAVARRDPEDDERIELVVREGEQVLGTWTARSTSSLPAEPDHLALSPDGSRLAFDVRFEDGTSAFVLDVEEAADGDLFDVARAVEPREEDGAMSSRPFWLDGRLGMVLGCCSTPGLDTWTAALVDASTEEVTRELFEVTRGVGSIDVATDGQGILLTLSHEAFGDRGPAAPDTLLRWDAAGEPVEVAEGLAVAW